LIDEVSVTYLDIMITKPNKDGKTPEALSRDNNYEEITEFLYSKNKDKTRSICEELENWSTTDVNKNDNNKYKKKKKKKNPNNKTSQIIK